MRLSASWAEVSAVTHIGFLVMISATVVALKSGCEYTVFDIWCLCRVLFHPRTWRPFEKQQLCKQDLLPKERADGTPKDQSTDPHITQNSEQWGTMLTVKIPLRCSSSSTTSTQSLLLAAISCAASMTKIFSRTVSAWAGRRAETVPATFFVWRIRVEPPRFFESSCSIFLRIAYWMCVPEV